MIGFRDQKTRRRPVYSVTGEKLCYLVSCSEGEWIYNLRGKRYAKITARHKQWKDLQANSSVTSNLMIGMAEIAW